MHRLLLTGASGFLGRNCLDALEGSWDVHAVDRRQVDAGPNVRWHDVDLLDAERVELLVRQVRPSHLLHLAWTAARPVYDSPENARWVEAGMALFESFADAGGRRVVGVGSSAEYEWDAGICREDETPLSTASAYSAAKVELGRRFASFCAGRRLSGAWARPFFLFGPYEHPGRFVASVVTSLLRGEPARCTHGRQVRDYLYAGDAAAALVHLLTSEFDGVVNVASGQPVALADLALAVGRQLGEATLVELGALPAPANEAESVVADVRRLHDEVGWRTYRDLEEGLRTTIDWWRAELETATPTGEVT